MFKGDRKFVNTDKIQVRQIPNWQETFYQAKKEIKKEFFRGKGGGYKMKACNYFRGLHNVI